MKSKDIGDSKKSDLLAMIQKYNNECLVIKDVNLIAMTEEKVEENISVYIKQGIIEAIGSFESLNLPKDTKIINAKGKYLLPGFSDMHVHLMFEEPQDEMNLYLANGITRVRNMFGLPWHREIQQRMSEDKLFGPDIFTTGPLLDGPGAFWPESVILENKEQAIKAVKEVKQKGFMAVKVYDRLSSEVFDQIMETAKEVDLPVMGHIPWEVGIENSYNAGLFSNEHFTGYNFEEDILPKQIDLTLEKNIWNCPTLVVLKNYEHLNALKEQETIEEFRYIPADIITWWKSAEPFSFGFKEKKELLNSLYHRGGNIVSGTDTGNPFVIPGFSLHEEFQLMNEAGLTAYEVLLTTTVNAAEMMGEEAFRGTVEEGKIADLVLLANNPLEDIRHSRGIDGVVNKGVWLSKEKLDGFLKDIEETYRADSSES